MAIWRLEKLETSNNTLLATARSLNVIWRNKSASLSRPVQGGIFSRTRTSAYYPQVPHNMINFKHKRASYQAPTIGCPPRTVLFGAASSVLQRCRLRTWKWITLLHDSALIRKSNLFGVSFFIKSCGRVMQILPADAMPIRRREREQDS